MNPRASYATGQPMRQEQTSPLRIIPVLDVVQGVVVHARGGQRQTYQPIQSTLTPSADPVQVAQAFRVHTGTNELYVADLDALAGREPQWQLLTRLVEAGHELLVDAGVRDVGRATRLASLGVQHVIVALECLPDWSVLGDAIASLGAERIVFSLDLRAGQPILAPRWSGAREVDALTVQA